MVNVFYETQSNGESRANDYKTGLIPNHEMTGVSKVLHRSKVDPSGPIKPDCTCSSMLVGEYFPSFICLDMRQFQRIGSKLVESGQTQGASYDQT